MERGGGGVGVVERRVNISGSSLGMGLEAIWDTIVGEVLAETVTVAAGLIANEATVGGGEGGTVKETEEQS